mgnify:CR=1 FL=1
MIFVLARALQQNVNDDKLIKSKPTLQTPHLRRSLSKKRSGAFRIERWISFKLCPGIYRSLKVIEITLVFVNIAK